MNAFEAKAYEFIRTLMAFRERVLQCCVDCGYRDINIREWVHAPNGNENYPTEVLHGQTVIAKMWVTWPALNRERFDVAEDYTIRMFASSDVPAIAAKLKGGE